MKTIPNNVREDVATCTNAELLSRILSEDVAQVDIADLLNSPAEQYTKSKKLIKKIEDLQATFILFNRLLARDGDTEKIKSSLTASRYMLDVFAGLQHEELWLLLLNNANKPIKRVQLSKGGLTSTTADVRVALRHALMNNATAMMMFHNHPSGLCRPSREDMDITGKFKEAARTMDIRFLDHIIISGKDDYYSFSDEGLL